MKKLRCAIYTRKSTDEGLDQAFNSLDAQREACAAYILSQAGECWIALKDVYDDGGFSGGSMERPALKQLMAEVGAGRVDIIVVYKVDRLTRSLADFARIVEVLDRAGASFVSVTQAFNTTTSMGRLTLNVLLSFAQFEREVTGERIRDKIAASKAKGMWMGGSPPLGYDVKERALVINETEAAVVRSIFERYLESSSAYALRDALFLDGIRSKAWTSRSGRTHGGMPITHGALYHILSNRIYLGEIVHRDRSYPGEHPPIIAADVFQKVQEKLRLAAMPAAEIKSVGRMPLLLGKLFDDAGAPMTSAHANKKKRRYFYYVSTALTQRKRTGSLPRVSAPRLERLVTEIVSPMLDPHWTLCASTPAIEAVRRVTLGRDRIVVEVAADLVTHTHRESLATDDATVRVERDHTLASPKALRRVMSEAAGGSVDRALVRAVVQARRWFEQIASGQASSIQAIAAQEDICPIYAGQLMPLAFLAPDLVEAILDGRQPTRLSLIRLFKATLPLKWDEQRTLFARFA